MHNNQYNWFEFQEHVPDSYDLDQFFAEIMEHVNPEQVKLISLHSLLLNLISMNRLKLLEL